MSVAPRDKRSESLSDTTVARVARTKTAVPDTYALRVASYNISGMLNHTGATRPGRSGSRTSRVSF